MKKNILEKKKNKSSNRNLLKIYFSGNIGQAQDIFSVIKTINILKKEKILWNFIGTGSELYNVKKKS